jgi:multidrug transporter EmrE-like cation transporter
LSAYVLGLLALWTTCEALGQVLFKRGIDSIGGGEARFGARTLRIALASPAIWGGIAVHVIEFAVWIEILGHLPLSVAFPLESISYVTVLVATRMVLREAIPPRRWMGVGLICAGIVVLGITS